MGESSTRRILHAKWCSRCCGDLMGMMHTSTGTCDVGEHTGRGGWGVGAMAGLRLAMMCSCSTQAARLGPEPPAVKHTLWMLHCPGSHNQHSWRSLQHRTMQGEGWSCM